MEVEFTLDIKPLSYNAYYRNTRNGKRVKTGAGLAYDEELELLLEDYALKLVDFAAQLDDTRDYIKLVIIRFNPNFLVKDGSRLNKTSGDVDNIVKVLQDKIFKVAGIDDFFVKDLRVVEMPALDNRVYINLKRESYPRLPR